MSKQDVFLAISWTLTGDPPSRIICSSAAVSSIRSTYNLSLRAANLTSRINRARMWAEDGGGAWDGCSERSGSGIVGVSAVLADG